MKRVRNLPDFRDPYSKKESGKDEVTGLETVTIYYGARDEENRQVEANGSEGIWKAILDDGYYYVTYFKLANYEGGKVDIDVEKHIQSILKQRQELVEKAKAYNQEEDYGHVAYKIKELMNTWKALEHVNIPYEQRLWKELIQNVDDFYKRLANYHEANKHAKLDVIKQVEALTNENQFEKNTKLVLDIQKQWKNIPSSGKKEDDVLWEQFKNVCDIFFNKKHELWEKEVLPKQLEAAEKKKVLIDRAIQASSLDLEEGLKEFKTLMALWKEIGYAGKEDQALWDAFNTHQQLFYGKRQAFYDEKHEQMKQNEKRKKTLIEEAKEINHEVEYSHDYSAKNTNRMKAIMEEFKQIPTSGYASDQRLWKNIRKIMDEYFDGLSKYRQFRNIL